MHINFHGFFIHHLSLSIPLHSFSLSFCSYRRAAECKNVQISPASTKVISHELLGRKFVVDKFVTPPPLCVCIACQSHCHEHIKGVTGERENEFSGEEWRKVKGISLVSLLQLTSIHKCVCVYIKYKQQHKSFQQNPLVTLARTIMHLISMILHYDVPTFSPLHDFVAAAAAVSRFFCCLFLERNFEVLFLLSLGASFMQTKRAIKRAEEKQDSRKV
jgi:hypothetical protein